MNFLHLLGCHLLFLKETNLNELVTGLGSLSILSRDDIKVSINVPQKSLYAQVDSNQIRQALLNLISNSINSIDENSENKSYFNKEKRAYNQFM